jgi:photosystem II stability/assembly factor-like uncharacterized protein
MLAPTQQQYIDMLRKDYSGLAETTLHDMLAKANWNVADIEEGIRIFKGAALPTSVSTPVATVAAVAIEPTAPLASSPAPVTAAPTAASAPEPAVAPLGRPATKTLEPTRPIDQPVINPVQPMLDKNRTIVSAPATQPSTPESKSAKDTDPLKRLATGSKATLPAPILFVGIGAAVLILIGSLFFILSGKGSDKKTETPISAGSFANPTPVAATPQVASQTQNNLVTTIYKDSVLRSTDAGESFETYFKIATSGAIGMADVLSISFHPLVRDRVAVTTYEDGLFFNEGRKNEWAPVPFPPKRIHGFILDKKDPDNRVFASGVVENNGRIFRATNVKSVQWKVVYAEPGTGTNVSALAQNPKAPDVILAGTSAGTLVKSVDGGSTWLNVGQRINGIISHFVFDSKDKNFNYLLSYVNAVYFTRNGGTEWLNWEEEKVKEVQKLNEQANKLSAAGDSVGARALWDQASALSKRNNDNRQPGGIVSITTDPARAGVIYAGTNNGLYRSTDYGKYWTKLNIIESAEHFTIPSLAVNPKDPSEIIFVAGKSFYKSTNGGETWATVPLDNSRNASFVAYDPFDPHVIFVGMSARQ